MRWLFIFVKLLFKQDYIFIGCYYILCTQERLSFQQDKIIWRGVSSEQSRQWREWDGASGRGSCARAVHWCAGAVEARGVGERNAVAASNDRARVASFTRSAGRRTTADPPTCPIRTVLHGPHGCDARFSTRSPLQKLSAPHSATVLLSLLLLC